MSTKPMQKNRPRLGRGLSSLISVNEPPALSESSTEEFMAPVSPSPVTPVMREVPSTQPEPAPKGEPLLLPITDIVPNPHQPRRSFEEATLGELAASIRSTGVIQPILVRKAGNQYQLIAGERRYRAAKLAGLREIPALLRDVDAVTQAQMALIENIQREDLNPIDRAQGYRTLIDQLGLTQGELAGRLGEDRSSIANFLRLLELAQPVQQMVRDGKLSVGHAKLIAGASDVLEQERLANLVILQGLSVRNLERVIKDGPKTPAAKPPAASAHLQDLEKSITRQLGLRVQVKSGSKKGKGRLVIHYSSLDQFDELLTRLNVRAD